jgi:DNA polymerase elongation subunit (family B)
MRKYYGLDTETPLGNIKVIATNEEVSEVETFDDILLFLGKHRYQGAIFWTFNLQFDVEHILKSTNNIDFLRELYEHGAQRPGIVYKDCFIQYIPRKLFKICKNKHCNTFYDIAQFYKGASLEKASQQYLGIGKLKDVDSKRLGEEVGYYERHKPETLKYCQRDAELTLKLAQKIEETFITRGVSFRNPISMAKISEVYVTDHYQYPKVLPEHKQMHIMAQLTFHGGLFWTLKRGFFKEPLYCFDINSAYPSVMQSLPHWANGSIKNRRLRNKWTVTIL